MVVAHRTVLLPPKTSMDFALLLASVRAITDAYKGSIGISIHPSPDGAAPYIVINLNGAEGLALANSREGTKISEWYGKDQLQRNHEFTVDGQMFNAIEVAS